MEFNTWFDPDFEPDSDPDFFTSYRNPHSIVRAWIIGYTTDEHSRALVPLRRVGVLYPADAPPDLPI
jgi:hypothetical protein